MISTFVHFAEVKTPFCKKVDPKLSPSVECSRRNRGSTFSGTFWCLILNTEKVPKKVDPRFRLGHSTEGDNFGSTILKKCCVFPVGLLLQEQTDWKNTAFLQQIALPSVIDGCPLFEKTCYVHVSIHFMYAYMWSADIRMHTYTYILINMYMYIYIYIHTYTHIYINISARIHRHMHC